MSSESINNQGHNPSSSGLEEELQKINHLIRNETAKLNALRLLHNDASAFRGRLPLHYHLSHHFSTIDESYSLPSYSFDEEDSIDASYALTLLSYAILNLTYEILANALAASPQVSLHEKIEEALVLVDAPFLANSKDGEDAGKVKTAGEWMRKLSPNLLATVQSVEEEREEAHSRTVEVITEAIDWAITKDKKIAFISALVNVASRLGVSLFGEELFLKKCEVEFSNSTNLLQSYLTSRKILMKELKLVEEGEEGWSDGEFAETEDGDYFHEEALLQEFWVNPVGEASLREETLKAVIEGAIYSHNSHSKVFSLTLGKGFHQSLTGLPPTVLASACWKEAAEELLVLGLYSSLEEAEAVVINELFRRAGGGPRVDAVSHK